MAESVFYGTNPSAFFGTNLDSTTVYFGTSFGTGVGISPLTGVSAFVDTTGVVQTSYSVTTTDLGESINYNVVVQVPVPFLQLNIDGDLVGDFIMPALTTLSVPKAVLNYIAQAEPTFDQVNQDIIDLMKAIPEATVTVTVKIGSVILVNLRFVAEKVPVVAVPPTFQLSLPNFAADASFAFTVPFPAPQALVIRVPIPVPQIASAQVLSISGGQVSSQVTGGASLGPTASATAAGGAATTGAFGAGATAPIVPVPSPIYLPTV